MSVSPILIVRLSATVSVGGLAFFSRTFREAGEEMEYDVGKRRLARRIAAGVVAVIRRDDHVFDRLRRQFLNVVDHRLALRLVALAVRDQNPVVRDHDHADGVDDVPLGIGRVGALIRIDIGRQLFPTWKVADLQSTRCNVTIADSGFFLGLSNGLEQSALRILPAKRTIRSFSSNPPHKTTNSFGRR